MSLYMKYLKVHFKCQLQYKMSFILSFLSQLLVVFGYYFSIICLFDKFSNIKGFTLYEVLLTYGIIQFGYSFCESFFRGIDLFDDLIITGDYDRILLRPRGILHQLICDKVNFVKMSRLIQGIIILIVAIINLDINWSVNKVIVFILMLLGSIFLFLGIFVITASYCFFTVKGLEINNVLRDGCKHMAQYPIGIFRKGFVIFFTYVVPIGFVNYYPLLYLLGKENNELLVYSPLITIVFLIITIIIFKIGSKKYLSTGS